jgi:hypothetical protein
LTFDFAASALALLLGDLPAVSRAQDEPVTTNKVMTARKSTFRDEYDFRAEWGGVI